MKERFDIARLAQDVRHKRGERGLREVADEIGVAFKTVQRIEAGYLPHVDTLTLFTAWLNKNAADYFIVDDSDHSQVAVQLRAMKKMSTETAAAFMDVIRAIYSDILTTSEEETA
ncbi:MAG: helix-turn-helix transcriptional regulator [bacterium]|nr:helix-turn-helix transcriptional regulator [bacterium]